LCVKQQVRSFDKRFSKDRELFPSFLKRKKKETIIFFNLIVLTVAQ